MKNSFLIYKIHYNETFPILLNEERMICLNLKKQSVKNQKIKLMKIIIKKLATRVNLFSGPLMNEEMH